MSTSDVRELTTEAEWRAAFPVLSQLREHLSEDQFIDRLRRMHEEGYRLFALFRRGEAVSVAGVALRTNFYNGRHLFVYDLVTRTDRRSEGHGSRLMAFLEDWARERNCESITLESGLWRSDAHRFYEDELGMERFCYTFKKELVRDDTA
ncbi:GNAT family N-acetyltransferase [Haloplanus salinarum]|uniref:GNAT family N-acetyltransferase n=1 Tax=Haloplanus salinarum TaxID=1912324 RepID=UPI00214AFEEB|nr:GNAT family N-acetyltransferase [Haloplanus salinarum]